MSEASKACTACISLVTRAAEPSECASRASCDRTRDWPALSKGCVWREKQTVIVRLRDGAAIGVLARTLARHSRFFATLLTSPGWHEAARGEIALTSYSAACVRLLLAWTQAVDGAPKRVAAAGCGRTIAFRWDAALGLVVPPEWLVRCWPSLNVTAWWRQTR